jgi:hypothetical protein
MAEEREACDGSVGFLARLPDPEPRMPHPVGESNYGVFRQISLSISACYRPNRAVNQRIQDGVGR